MGGGQRQRQLMPAKLTGALHASKTEATGVVIIARWLLENNLNVSSAQVLRTEI